MRWARNRDGRLVYVKVKVKSVGVKRKVKVGAVAGALVSLALYCAALFAGVETPAGVEAALTTVVSAVLAYWVPEPNRQADDVTDV